MKWYLVAYGHAMRAEKASSPQEAMKLAFGTVDDDRMTLAVTPGVPRNVSRKALGEIQVKLAKRHFARTGSILSGYEREPGIANVHWAECQLCRKPITTEPKSGGIDECCCVACDELLERMPEEEQEALSTAKIREKLGVTIHHSVPLV